VGEDILDAGEIVIGIDLDGDDPGEVSKCILMCIVYGVGLVCMYIHSAATGVVGRKAFCSGPRCILRLRALASVGR
jgi:hypothetical protein